MVDLRGLVLTSHGHHKIFVDFLMLFSKAINLNSLLADMKYIFIQGKRLWDDIRIFPPDDYSKLIMLTKFLIE